MKDILIYIIMCFVSVGLAALLGFSEQAGLFGAILGGGAYIIGIIDK